MRKGGGGVAGKRGRQTGRQLDVVFRFVCFVFKQKLK